MSVRFQTLEGFRGSMVHSTTNGYRSILVPQNQEKRCRLGFLWSLCNATVLVCSFTYLLGTIADKNVKSSSIVVYVSQHSFAVCPVGFLYLAKLKFLQQDTTYFGCNQSRSELKSGHCNGLQWRYARLLLSRGSSRYFPRRPSSEDTNIER